jgi:hypothetical protein
MEKKTNVLNDECIVNNENKVIEIGLVAEYNRIKNFLSYQYKLGIINRKEYHYFKSYYLLNLTNNQ